jgi:hypothetical protein
MKQILNLLMAIYSLTAMGQYPVSSISITLPPQPKPNTGDWAMPFVITAQAKLVNGQVPGNLVESRILVTIKKNGSKFCGNYTQQNAPYSQFNSPTKTWSGGVAINLVSTNCEMPPGNYELCVQFFTSSLPVMPLSNEVCKSFTIPERNSGPVNYSPPQNIMPFDGKVFTQQEADLPISFRWMPVQPKPNEDIFYKIRLFEIMPGQSKIQALSNTPVEEKELRNETQTSFRLGKRNNAIVWYVDATSGFRIPGGPVPKNYGKSEVTTFSFRATNGQDTTGRDHVLSLLQPADGTVIKAANVKKPINFTFTVNPKPDPSDNTRYDLKVWEVPDGKTAAQVMLNGETPFIERRGRPMCCVGHVVSLPPKSEGKRFAWTIVEVKEGPVQGQEVKQGKLLFNEFSVEKAATGRINPGPITVQSQCDVNSKIESYKCLGKDANGNLVYSVTTNFIVNSSTAGAVTHFNDPINKSAPYCTTYGPVNIAKGNPPFIEVNGTGMNNVAMQNDMIAISGPFKATYSNGYYPITYKITIPAGTTQIIVGYYFYTTPDNATCVPKDTINIDAPCPCDLCETLSWGESGNMATLSQDKNSAQISQAFSIPSIKIKQVTAEIIGFDWQVNDDCKKCLKETYGYFIGGTASGEQVPNTDASFPVVDGMPLLNGFELDWNLCGNKRPQPLNGTFKMDVALPPATSLSCCTDQFNICIRYTILTDDCRTCSKVICYPLSRKHGGEK